ncbi:MAG: hypothetical protein DMF63_11900 [Acidobacteria bacterium]|nr:MAG: hypothetical protein DMF63_11900 [Acidobacteriota bacterium]
MRRIGVLLILLGMFVSIAPVSEAQDRKEIGPDAVVQPSESRPEMGLELSANAKAKVFLPRTKFRLGELVKADVVLRLTNKYQYYFTPEFHYRIIIEDSKGSPVVIKSIANVDTFLGPRYEKVTDTLLIQSSYLVIGCRVPIVRNFEKSIEIAEMDNPDWLFENNLFSPPAEACIDVTTPGQLELNVVVFNDRVVVPATGDNTKTLVGSIRGKSFRMSIER